MKRLDLDRAHDVWAYPAVGTFHPDGTYSTEAANGYVSVASDEVGYRFMYIFPSGQVEPNDGHDYH